MIWTFNGLVLLLLFSDVLGSQSLSNVQWLPCQLIDEQVHKNEEGHTETQYRHRPAGLQFGQAGDKVLNKHVITFLVGASKADMRRYIEGEEETLQCEIRRYSTGGIQVRWPSQGAQDHDTWFSCTLRHSQGLFVITTFLRHTPAKPITASQDYLEWNPIEDNDVLTTSAVMLVLTRTPAVQVGLLKEQKLHCQFAVDHKLPNLTVEWRHTRRGDRTKLFSYVRSSGKADGSGASVKAIAAGDASLKLPLTKQTSEGTYVCSVYVPPLYGSHDITLSIMEPPRVSVNVDSTLSMTEGAERKVVCDAESYYPLDVVIEWLREPSSGSRLPEVLKNVLFSSHRHRQDGTYSLTAFFWMRPSLRDSGYRYTCRVSHPSLRVPIRKSFTLMVSEEISMFWYGVGLMTVVLLLVLVVMLYNLISARREFNKRKPY
ncbi:tapasin-related protein-like [Chanos chanos]|uniref:Tapasin-related protein-like n=1 Tax=Chanos chanos TaxID=29144 RepID=A0A6J2VN89_CHACN|nr:tapasin-related protein-like [Chanos chanos]